MQNLPVTNADTAAQNLFTLQGMQFSVDKMMLASKFLGFMDIHASQLYQAASVAEPIQLADAAQTASSFATQTAAAGQASIQAQPATARPVPGKALQAQDSQPQTADATASQETKAATASDTKISKEDFEGLKKRLKSVGLTDKEISALAERVASTVGLTFGELVAFLTPRMSTWATKAKAADVSSLDKSRIEGLLGKLGFSNTDARSLTQDLIQGKQGKVFSAIAKQLNALPQDQTISLDGNEVQSFLSALNLPQATSEKFKQAMTQAATPKALQDLMAGLKSEAASVAAKESGLTNELAKALNKNLVRRAQGSADSPDGRFLKFKSNERMQDGLKQVETSARKSKTKDDSAQAEANWKEFASRLRQEGTLETKPRQGSDSLKGGLAEGMAKAAAQPNTGWEKVAAPRLASQVQSAIFKNLTQGKSQLTLQLEPQDLGKLSIQLTVKDKDVQAVIRADTPEAGKIIAEQLDGIRKALEDQGLKVSKIEVQTQLASSDQNSAGWLGAQAQNDASDRQSLAHLRGLRRLLGDDADDLGADADAEGIVNPAAWNLGSERLHVIA
jgi:flagellar hook-length control protein FliK